MLPRTPGAQSPAPAPETSPKGRSPSLAEWTRRARVLAAKVPLDSLRTQLLIFALLATLIPSLATAVISYTQNKRALTAKITEELRGSSTQAARELDLWFRQRAYDARVFASSYEVTENVDLVLRATGDSAFVAAARDRLTNYLAAVSDRFSAYNELLVVDLRGQILARSGSATDPVELPREWQAAMRDDRPAAGTAVPDMTRSGSMAVPVAVPLRAPDARLLGALVVRLSLQDAEEILHQFTASETGALSVLDGHGNVIVTTDADRVRIGPAEAHQEAVHRGVDEVVEYQTSDGRSLVGTLRAVPQIEWAVLAEVPRQVAYAPVARLRNITVFVVAALLFGVGLLAYRLGLLIVRPLDRLTEGAAGDAGGDLSIDLPVTAGGEVGYLTRVFNDMVAGLRGSRAELDTIHDALRAKNEELERLSLTDGLTGLTNRRHLMEILEHEARRTRRSKHPFSLLVVDVDHFKQFNDTYGHLVGDQVLQKVAHTLQNATRDVDTTARFGGEEFVVLLPETDLQGAVQAAERVRTRLAAEKFSVGEGDASLTVSIGVAEYPTDGETPEAVIGSADAALYRAKRAGRNRVGRATRRKNRKASAGKRGT